MVGCFNSSVVGTWERGSKTPSLDNVLALSAALGCPVEILFLERFKSIRTGVHQRMATLPARRYANLQWLSIGDGQPTPAYRE